MENKLQLFEHQVAGHKSTRKKINKDLLTDGSKIFKAVQKTEKYFYEVQIKKLDDLSVFCPHYFGSKKLVIGDYEDGIINNQSINSKLNLYIIFSLSFFLSLLLYMYMSKNDKNS